MINLCQLRGGRKPAQSAKDDQRDIMNAQYLTLHDNNVTQSTVIHSSYTKATTSYLIVWLACLLCHIAGKPVNILIYANDLVLLARYDQQSLLSTCARAVTDLHMFFHTSKSYTMIFEPYRTSQRILCLFPSVTLMSIVNWKLLIPSQRHAVKFLVRHRVFTQVFMS